MDATELNSEQRRAVEHGAGPLMVLAGAGSGKTRVLVHRIARLVARGDDPSQILAVTFTNKAAGEMRERLRAVLGRSAERMWIGTFHATCGRLLRTYHERVGLSRDFTIFDDDDQLRLIDGLLKEHGLQDALTARNALTRIDRIKNRGGDARELHTGRYADDLVARIWDDYQRRLAQEDAVDFNDLLLKVLELAEDPLVGPELAGRFRHVLVDEFQDTNLVQYRLVRALVQRTRNLTVVGDDDQSIYSWRGAEPRNLLDFEQDFPDAVVVKLEQNYRSTAVILEAANAIICHNEERHEKRLWTAREGGEPLLWEECETERAEAEFVARAIIGLTSEEGRALGDVAVLYRTHAQSRVLEEMLRAYRVPYRLVGGVSFFQRKEIKDVRAYLRLVCNPSADSAFERIVNVPARGIGKTTIDRVRAHARVAGLSLLDAARSASHGAVATLPGAARKKLASFVDIVDGLRDVQGKGASVAELIIQAAERSGYRERLEIEDTPDARERLQNLSELVSMATEFDDETGGRGTLVEFDERISLASANDAADGRGAAVSLMTIHAAKGLEFPVVLLCGLEDGLFPQIRPRDTGDESRNLEEERRLAYVALTRARDRLVLTCARTRRQWAEVRFNQPSRFLDDIPASCLAVRAPSRPVAVRAPAAPPMAARVRTMRRTGMDELAQPYYDDFDQRSHHDEVNGTPLGFVETDDEFGAGATVLHASFGEGRVVESRGSGRDRKLVIAFRDGGLKTILARFVEPGSN